MVGAGELELVAVQGERLHGLDERSAGQKLRLGPAAARLAVGGSKARGEQAERRGRAERREQIQAAVVHERQDLGGAGGQLPPVGRLDGDAPALLAARAQGVAEGCEGEPELHVVPRHGEVAVQLDALVVADQPGVHGQAAAIAVGDRQLDKARRGAGGPTQDLARKQDAVAVHIEVDGLGREPAVDEEARHPADADRGGRRLEQEGERGRRAGAGRGVGDHELLGGGKGRVELVPGLVAQAVGAGGQRRQGDRRLAARVVGERAAVHQSPEHQGGGVLTPTQRTGGLRERERPAALGERERLALPQRETRGQAAMTSWAAWHEGGVSEVGAVVQGGRFPYSTNARGSLSQEARVVIA